MDRMLRKVKEKKWIGGVAAGVAYWLGVPAWLVRVVWVFSVLCWGAGLILYVLLWIFMPAWEETPEDYDKVAGG